ncbi:MAG: ABC transporter substrate-binding protein, partial [Chloroflexota bacterium]|nr:ABC transporter substrate-binding protein [Chloroflexota bacterium]
ADVKASFERQIWPPKGILSPRGAGFASVEKIEAPDDSTVRFLLKFPQASLLEMTAMPFTWVFPKRILDAKGDMKKDVMGSGPFKLKEYLRAISFELVKNPDYFMKDRPYLDGITRYIIRDIGAIHAAFKSGRIQQLVGIQGELYGPELAKLQQDMPNIVVQKAAETTKPYLFPNHTRKPWNDVRVRKAIDLAIDRQAGIQVVFKGDATVGSYFMPGSGWEIPTEELLKMPGYRQPKDQDIAEAKRLLAEAGYPNGFKTNIITRVDLKFTVDEAVFFKDQLRKIGIDADVSILEVGVFYALQSAADFDLNAHAFTVATPEPDVLIAEQYTTTSGANWGRYLNPKIDEIFFKQMKTVDPAERRKLLREMQEILMSDYMRVVLAWRRGSTVAWPQVKGYVMG